MVQVEPTTALKLQAEEKCMELMVITVQKPGLIRSTEVHPHLKTGFAVVFPEVPAPVAIPVQRGHAPAQDIPQDQDIVPEAVDLENKVINHLKNMLS